MEHERREQVGEKAEQHKAGDGLDDVLESTGAHDHQDQQGVHDDGLQAHGQIEANAASELGDDGGQAGQPAGGEAVGNHEGVGGEAGDGATRDDERKIAHELRFDDAVDVDAPCHMTPLDHAAPITCPGNSSKVHRTASKRMPHYRTQSAVPSTLTATTS